MDVRTAGRALTSSEAAAYLGDSECARCHQEEGRQHKETRHSRTLRRVRPEAEGPAFARKQVVIDPVRRLTYRTGLVGQRCVIKGTDGQRSGEMAADYVLGTGRNAMTFLAEGDSGRWMKMRLSYYAKAGRWHFTPSQLPGDDISGPPGIIETPASLTKCLLCHTTVLRKDAGRLVLAQSTLGVGCERCHGPGRRHVEQVEKAGTDAGMERLGAASPARINQICGTCHHTSENVVLKDARVQRNLPRFQGPALEQSECYQKSGKLSCVTCHNPHQDASPSLTFYDATCRSCHSLQRKQATCPVSTVAGCTGCHMPRRSIEGVPFTGYRHHWIKVWKKTTSRPGETTKTPGRATEQF